MVDRVSYSFIVGVENMHIVFVDNKVPVMLSVKLLAMHKCLFIVRTN